MPHLVLEIPADLPPFDGQALLSSLHRLLFGSGHFEAADIKGRILRPEVQRVGGDCPEDAFVHAELRLLPGRPPEVLARLAGDLATALDLGLPPVPGKRLQVTVEVLEIVPERYAKRWRNCRCASAERVP